MQEHVTHPSEVHTPDTDQYDSSQEHPTGEETSYATSERSVSDPLSIPPPFKNKRPSLRLLALIFAIITVIILLSGSILPLLLTSPSSLATGPVPVGRVVFASSGQLDPQSTQGLNDIVTLDLLHGIGKPGPDRAYYAWLLPDPGNDQIRPLLLGKFSPTDGTITSTYTSQNHDDLLTTHSGFLITEEDASTVPSTPTLNTTFWRYQGSIPNTPTPGDEQRYSLLSHLRHLLAQDPTLQEIGLSGGLDIWLYRNSQKLLEYTSSARDEWSNGQDVDLMRRQIIRTLQYLDGANYSQSDTPEGTPWLIDPKAGRLGLLDVVPNQTPPGYLSHVLIHLDGLINAPGSNSNQKQLALTIDTTTKQVTVLYQEIRNDAIQLIKMTDAQLLSSASLSLLDDMTTKANAGFAGQTDPATGNVEQGINWVHGKFQQLANFDVYQASH